MTKAGGISAIDNVLVFRSNIDTDQNVALACRELLKLSGVHQATIDLDDWENVLRVVCDPVIHSDDIEKEVNNLGFECEELAALK